MGRNSIPKLEEWREGILYRFRVQNGPYDKNKDPWPTPNDGRMIVYEKVTRNWNGADFEYKAEILACCYADGFLECMASMWQSGFHKGEITGYDRAKREMRAALGIKDANDG